MRKMTLAPSAFLAVGALGASVAHAASPNAAAHYVAPDPLYPQFGLFDVLDNNAGVKFTWTMVSDFGPSDVTSGYTFLAGHTYHEIDKIHPDDPENWCGPIPYFGKDRTPYSLTRHRDEVRYYQQFDVTTGERVPICVSG
jgi:hypothetical protein